MSKLNLKFTFKNIDEIEKATGHTFFSLFNDLGVGTLGVIMQKCGKTDDEIEAAFAELGIDGVIKAIMEDLKSAGFLPKAFEIPQMDL